MSFTHPNTKTRAISEIRAAEAIVNAKLSEHEAAFFMGDKPKIEAAREAVLLATETFLDTRERAFMIVAEESKVPE